MSFVLSEESEAEYRVSTVRTGRGVLYESTLDCLLKTAKSEGPLTVFRGFSMQWLRLGPHTTISLMCFEQLRHLETWTQFCFTFCDTFVLSQFVPFMFFPVVFLFVCPKGCLTFFTCCLLLFLMYIYILYNIIYYIIYIRIRFSQKVARKASLCIQHCLIKHNCFQLLLPHLAAGWHEFSLKLEHGVGSGIV